MDWMGGGGAVDPAQGLNANLRRRRGEDFESARNKARAKPLGEDTSSDNQQISSQNPVYEQLRAYKFLLEHNAVLRAQFNHDRTLGMEAIGTLARYELTVQGMPKNFEGRSPSQLNLFLRKFLSIIDNGVGTLVVRWVTLYTGVAVLFSLFFITFPEIEAYIAALGINEAISLLDLVIGIVVQRIILSALWSFIDKPRSLKGSYERIVRMIDAILLHYGSETYATQEEKTQQSDKALEVVGDLVDLGTRLIALYTSFATGDVFAQDYFFREKARIKNKIFSPAFGMDRSLAERIASELDGLAASEISDSLFFRLFHYFSVTLTHFEGILVVYLFFVVPVQIWTAVGFMIFFVYPIMMYFLHILRKEENLLGSPFAWNTGIGQETRYGDWDNVFLEQVDALVEEYNFTFDLYARK